MFDEEKWLLKITILTMTTTDGDVGQSPAPVSQSGITAERIIHQGRFFLKSCIIILTKRIRPSGCVLVGEEVVRSENKTQLVIIFSAVLVSSFITPWLLGFWGRQAEGERGTQRALRSCKFLKSPLDAIVWDYVRRRSASPQPASPISSIFFLFCLQQGGCDVCRVILDNRREVKKSTLSGFGSGKWTGRATIVPWKSEEYTQIIKYCWTWRFSLLFWDWERKRIFVLVSSFHANIQKITMMSTLADFLSFKP